MASNDLTSNVEPVLPTQPESPPAAPPMNLTPTVPPQEVLNGTPVSSSPPPTLAQPPATPNAPVPAKKSFPIKIILILLILLMLLGVGAFIVSRVLPSLGGGANQEATLTWWGLWEDDVAIAPLISEYQQSHPNIKINYVKQSKDDYRERLTSALAGGNGPDIFRFHSTWTPMFKNILEPMPQTVMSSSDFAKTFFPVASADLAVGSSVIGMPLEFDSIALFINEEIFQTYLKEPPTTWDDFRSLARELTIKDENGVIRQAGAAMGITENVDHWPEIIAMLMIQNKVKMSAPTGTLAEQALDFYTRFSRVDEVWDTSLPSSTIAFSGGKLAMYLGPSWRAHEIRQQNPSLRFRVVTVPQLQKAQPEDPSTYYATYWAEGVSSESKSKEAAWEFLKFLSSSEALQKFYQNASGVDPHRRFGEPYPRVDMVDLLSNDPIVGAFVKQGREAKSWYLASRTFDGPTGINTQLAKYFEDAINKVNEGESPERVLGTVAAGVTQVLSQYGLAPRPATPEP